MQHEMENLHEKKKQCEMKTDLNLLLECLKYQMDSPESQKDVLITIYSVCQKNSDACDYFREIGGLMFISNLAKSSSHSIVKEAALFTLGGLAESNVFCQQMLCTDGLFSDVILMSSNKDSSLNLKRMSVYIILVLTSNNKAGQTVARETGCIDVLLQLFRETLSVSEIDLSNEETCSCYQLWSSVCSTLCACTNNPQNDENQKKCCSAFPYANRWLQKVTSPEIVRPICSFIGLAVANNSVQEYFAQVGGLDTLAGLLLKLVDESQANFSNAKLAIIVIKTLDACISDNCTAVFVLSKYQIVSSLLKLLLHDSLESADKFSIILALGHCTDACEENQYELLKNNGLPLMIEVLTESQDEELNKAITFVLQNCKKMTEDLSLNLNGKSSNVNDTSSLMDTQREGTKMNDYSRKAKEILKKIEQLERQQEQDMKDSFQSMETLNTSEKIINFSAATDMCHPQPKQMSLNDKLHTWPPFFRCGSKADGNGNMHSNLLPNVKSANQISEVTPELLQKIKLQSSADKINEEAGQHRESLIMERVRRQLLMDNERDQESIREREQDHLRVKASVSSVCDALVSDDVCHLTLENEHLKIANASNNNNRLNILQPVDATERWPNDTNGKEADEAGLSSQKSEHTFKAPDPVSRNVKQKAYIDPFTLCSDLIDKEINNSVSTSNPADLRCSDTKLTPFSKGNNYKSCLQNENISQQKFQSLLLTPIKNAKTCASNQAQNPQKYEVDCKIRL